jgi:hypothetical protein
LRPTNKPIPEFYNLRTWPAAAGERKKTMDPYKLLIVVAIVVLAVRLIWQALRLFGRGY